MSPNGRDRVTTALPYLCLAGAVLLWGTSFMAMKIALRELEPMTMVWLRMLAASAVFLPFVRRLPRPEYRTGDWKWLAAMCLLQPCVYFLCEGYGVQLTTSSQAGMISALVPLLVALGAWWFLGEKLPKAAGIGVGLSLIGVVLLSMGASAGAHAPNPILGNGLELLAMTSAAGYMLLIKHLSSRYSPWLLTGLLGLTGAVFFAPIAIAVEGVPDLALSLTTWGAVAYLGAAVTLGAFGLNNIAISRLPASRATVAINFIPAVAVLAGWLVLDETLSALQLIACVVIAVGVVLGVRGSSARMAESAGD
jgi:drug/metabolite transporter (DMT)-like permease